MYKSHFECICIHNLRQQQENWSNGGHFWFRQNADGSSTITHGLQPRMKGKPKILSGLRPKGKLKRSVKEAPIWRVKWLGVTETRISWKMPTLKVLIIGSRLLPGKQANESRQLAWECPENSSTTLVCSRGRRGQHVQMMASFFSKTGLSRCDVLCHRKSPPSAANQVSPGAQDIYEPPLLQVASILQIHNTRKFLYTIRAIKNNFTIHQITNQIRTLESARDPSN